MAVRREGGAHIAFEEDETMDMNEVLTGEELRW